MDCDRIRIILEVARAAMRVNREHKDVNSAAGEVIHCFALRNTDYRTTRICQAVQKV